MIEIKKRKGSEWTNGHAYKRCPFVHSEPFYQREEALMRFNEEGDFVV
jgi:hypothetical protein